MKTLIEDYRNLPAGHCGSGAMANLIYHYTGLDLPEGVIFGLGAGIDAIFFSYDHEEAPFMLFGRNSSMEADLATTLGLDYSMQMEADDDKAWELVRAEVEAGKPTLLSGDIFYLDYRDFKVHFPAHKFVLLGFDEEAGETYIADRIRPEAETCSMQALRLSRNPPVGISTFNEWDKFSSGAQRHSMPDACGLALKMAVERMQGIDSSQKELMGAAQGGGGAVETGLKGLLAFSKALPGFVEHTNASGCAQYVDNAIIKYGTGGGFFRDHYAAFMRFAREHRPDLVSTVTVDLAQEAADRWNALSPTMQHLVQTPEDKDAWSSAHTQVLDIYETEYSLFGHLADTVLRTH